MGRLLIALLFSIFSFSAKAAVWEDTNAWSAAYEDKFAEWVRTSWHVGFFAQPTLPNGQANPYYKLHADCADTVYSMRIVFAYENRLPFVVQDPTASGKIISNRMDRWNNLDEVSRVRKFLVFIFNTLSTRSLPNDTYPIAINPQVIRSGALIATTKTHHHSWTLKEILSIGVPHLVYNSVVGANSGYTLQERKSWPNPEWVFAGNFTPQGHAGFRYWRPAEFLNKPVWEVPGYSEEQYKIPLKKWTRTVQARLARTQETDQQMLERLLQTSCQGFKDRVPTVHEGIDYLEKNPRCMDYATYDTYSTPNRDNRIFDDLMAVRRAYAEILQLNNGSQLSGDIVASLNKIFPAINQSARKEAASMPVQQITQTSICVTEYTSGRSIDLAEFKRRLFAGSVSNNPHDGYAQRWGETREPSERAKKCQSWDPWKPDLGSS